MVFIFLAYFTLCNGLQFHPSQLEESESRNLTKRNFGHCDVKDRKKKFNQVIWLCLFHTTWVRPLEHYLTTLGLRSCINKMKWTGWFLRFLPVLTLCESLSFSLWLWHLDDGLDFLYLTHQNLFLLLALNNEWGSSVKPNLTRSEQ